MDSIRRNRQIDSFKYLILMCQDGNSLITSVGSGDQSSETFAANTSPSGPVGADTTGPYENPLLKELTELSKLRAQLREAVLLADTCLLTGDGLPSASLLGDLMHDLNQLGTRLASVNEHAEMLSWRLLHNKFTNGLDLPYSQHGAVKALLHRMAGLVTELSDVELTLQRAVSYKPSGKTAAYLTTVTRALLELRAGLESIQTLRHSFTTGPLAPRLGSRSSLTSGDDSTL